MRFGQINSLVRAADDSEIERRAIISIEERATPKAPAGKPSLKLEFTKYPSKKQKWTPPRPKKPVTKPAKRHELTSALAKRTKIDAAEGTTQPGKSADELRTWHVINCIAIAAYDNATGAKAMAHINAVSATGVEYADQFGKFADPIFAWKGPVEIWVRWPHKTAIPADRADLAPKQKEFENSIREYLAYMKAPQFKVFHQQAKRREGDMVMTAGGDVAVDT
ncbi:hypothetical protein E8E13_000672 [Curvularia kusanoi]|uniref:Uncharacterized protein n=1 Tax=Curvularia kusanoi TaxID=90978 RepID=A0A9P4W6P5_CURKU|nr:hypothetical protein E8E13_000672 [Curvularia kusanoi]